MSNSQYSSVNRSPYNPAHTIKRYSPTHYQTTKYKNSVDLRKYMNCLVYNQAYLNSCAANAVCAAYALDLQKQDSSKWFAPSPLYLYYNTRVYESLTYKNIGTHIPDEFQVLNNQGVCKESDWPFNPAYVFVKPSQKCYESANGHKCKYERLLDHIDSPVGTAQSDQNILQLKACLADDCPFVFGFHVYESFESDGVGPNGIMTLPKPDELPGSGHAVVAVGYDDVKKHFIVLNSWGQEFGDKGYFYMPYTFMVDPKWCFDHYKLSYVYENN